MATDPNKVAQAEALHEVIYDYIREFTEEHGRAPRQAETAAAVGCGQSTVRRHIAQLATEGRVRKDGRGGSARVI